MNFVGIPRIKVLIFVLAILAGTQSIAQDVDFENLLERIDTIENPVYMPMVSIGYGPLYFIGDAKNNSNLPVIGTPAIKATLTSFVDKKHYFFMNFFFMAGKVRGNQRSYLDNDENLNFESDIKAFGASSKYEFGHLFSQELRIRPYISFGIEQLRIETNFESKDSLGNEYFYWTDGTVRDISESAIGVAKPLTIDWDYNDLKTVSNRSFGIPIEIGFSLKVSKRVFFSLGTEYHYTFTPFTEVSSGSSKPVKDKFLFTNATLQFDLFSEASTVTVDLLYADYDMGFMSFDDEDGDMVPDNFDYCPGTPYGVVTDTLGCPLDNDKDGVPDYMDKEANTAKGVWVDDDGVTLSEDDFLKKLSRERALKREDLEAYMALMRDSFSERKVENIPEKFAQLDTDGDGYISFDELLKVIDGYFDFTVNLTLDELRQVNEFFFSQ